MGTSLTGLTPSTTYDALIKVGDNGPLSATAKFLSDGLGNDSPLAMSTTLVGIGTASPNGKFEVALAEYTNEDQNSNQAIFGNGVSSNGVRIGYNNTNNVGYINALKPGVAWSNLVIGGNSVRFTANGNEIARITTNGLTFNGDTAAANALDDYEEGTWTMGISFGGASVGVTTLYNTGTYTKIGRQVTVNGLLTLSSKGSSAGAAVITGLPFTINNSLGNYAAAALWLENITFTDQFQSLGAIGATTIELHQISGITGVQTQIGNTSFANNSQVLINFTYFV